MNYLSQPNAGFLLLTSQLFSGRVIAKPGIGSGLDKHCSTLILTSSSYFQSTAARADGILIPHLRKALSVACKRIATPYKFTMTYELEKRIFTDKDFENMGWHDSQVYKVRLIEDLELDIDYILQWNKPDLEGLPFTFWVAPATLVFKRIKNLTFDFATGFENAFEIDDIEKPTIENGNQWTIITQQGDFQFTCDGFEQFIRQDPFFEFGQTISYSKRNGYCLDRTTNQENPIRNREDILEQRQKELDHFENVKKRHLKNQELVQLNKLRENNEIDTKTYLVKKKEINDLIFSYSYFLKGTQFESWGSSTE